MSFIRIILVSCIFYALCSILYKWYSKKKALENLAGPEFLKSLDQNACGVIFYNNTGKSITLKLQGIDQEKVLWTEHCTLEPDGGKLPFFAGTQLRVSISDENYIDIMLTEPHTEYTITLSSDFTLKPH